jgi:hypothetical protein
MNAACVKKVYGVDSSLYRNARTLKESVLRECHPAGNAIYMKLKYGDANGVLFDSVPKLITPDFYPLRPK